MLSGDAVQMDSTQRMVFYAAKPAFWSSKYNRDGVPDKGTRSFPTNIRCSLYYCRWYDYVTGLADRFHNVVHAVEQPL